MMLLTRLRAQLDTSCIGSWTRPASYVVRRERLGAFSSAPLVFASVVMGPTLRQTLAGAAPERPGLRLQIRDLDLRARRQLVVGDVMWTRGRVIGMHAGSSGVVVSTQVETREASGHLVVLQFSETVVHDAVWPRRRGERIPRADRVAESTGGLTVVGEEARLGHPGVPLAELQLLAVAGRSIVRSLCADEPERLTRLACRFADPGYGGDDLVAGIWPTGGGTAATCGFEVAAGSRVLLRHGWAEVTSPLAAA